MGRPERDEVRLSALRVLGSGLSDAGHDADALPVREAELSTRQRLGDGKTNILAAQSNLAISYERLGQSEKALRMTRDVYSGTLKLYGEDHRDTLLQANNYADSLIRLQRFEEAKALLRKPVRVARRVLGESHDVTLRMRWGYAEARCRDDGATLDHLREAVTTLEETERIARRVLGGAHPITVGVESTLRGARSVLRARETPDA